MGVDGSGFMKRRMREFEEMEEMKETKLKTDIFFE